MAAMSELDSARRRVRRLTSAQSLDHALWVAEVGAVMLIQPMFLLAAAFSQMLVPIAVPVGVHGIVFVIGVVSLLRGLSAAWLLGATYVACLVDLAVAFDDRQLLFTFAFIVLVLAAVIPILLWEGAKPLITGGCVAVAGAVTVMVSQAGGLGTALRLVLAVVALGLAVVILIRGIRGFTRMIDAEEASVWEAEQRAIVQRAVAETTAEHARVLHDTVINTFALLAREAHGEKNRELIRERCRSNLERVAELRRAPRLPAGAAASSTSSGERPCASTGWAMRGP